MAVVYPSKDDFARVYQLLESLAGSPHAIRSTRDGGPGLGLVISDDLYRLYVEAEESEETDEKTEQTETVKRRPGRPRKTQES